jgi:hypothetical protein
MDYLLGNFEFVNNCNFGCFGIGLGAFCASYLPGINQSLLGPV